MPHYSGVVLHTKHTNTGSPCNMMKLHHFPLGSLLFVQYLQHFHIIRSQDTCKRSRNPIPKPLPVDFHKWIVETSTSLVYTCLSLLFPKSYLIFYSELHACPIILIQLTHYSINLSQIKQKKKDEIQLTMLLCSPYICLRYMHYRRVSYWTLINFLQSTVNLAVDS